MSISRRDEIGRRVLAYLVTHADAGDTLEGIVEWWLMEQEIRYSTAQVKEVLEDFTLKQLILEYKASDRRVHYRINRSKEKEIQALLKSSD